MLATMQATCRLQQHQDRLQLLELVHVRRCQDEKGLWQAPHLLINPTHAEPCLVPGLHP